MTQENEKKQRSGLLGLGLGYVVAIIVLLMVSGSSLENWSSGAIITTIIVGFPFAIIGYLIDKNL